MHKQWLNHLQIEMLLEPEGGLLIKAGSSPIDPARPDMTFVRTVHPATGEETVYLPGSSLKGVLRSHVERRIRSALGEQRCWVCNPLAKNGERALCSRRLGGGTLTSAQVYARSCLACRTFGNTRLAGRLLAADAFPLHAVSRLPTRQGVGIDRRTGTARSGVLYDLEVAPPGTIFRVRLQMHNFELWQAGLLAQALQDMNEGWVRLGYGKSRGLGQVRLLYTQLRLTYFLPPPGEPAAWYGVAALAPHLREPYRLLETHEDDTRPATLPLAAAPEIHPAQGLGVELRWGLAEPIPWGSDVEQVKGQGAAHSAITQVLQGVQAAWRNFVASPPQAPEMCGQEWSV